jgi:hypothetical protein
VSVRSLRWGERLPSPGRSPSRWAQARVSHG